MPLSTRITTLVLLVLSLLAGCSQPKQRYEFSEIIMAVEARIVVWAGSEDEARGGARAAFDRMKDLNAVMSDYRASSELMRLCAGAGTGPVQASEDLLCVLDASDRIVDLSGGAFDPTIGPIVKLWRSARRSGTAPDGDALSRARGLTGWALVALDPDTGTVALERAGMQLDLGGIGKGFAADEALVVLERRGLRRGLVDLGGDIALGAPPPEGDGWTLAVDLPSVGRRTFSLANAAVATSSDAVQFVEIGGVRYSHILDPRRGEPLTVSRQVTVIAPTATEADALASALSVLDADEGLRLVESLAGVEAWIVTTGTEPVLRRSSGFPARMPGE